MITIGFLADYPDTVPTLASWFRDQWPDYYADMSQEELDEQNGEALPDGEAPSAVRPLSDPDLDVTLDPPKESREPGLPPPRD